MNLSLKKSLAAVLALAGAASALSAQTAMNLGSLPLWFEANATAPAQFTAHGHDSEFSISATGVEFMLRQPGGRTASARMTFMGAEAQPQISGDNELAGKINRLIGNNPAKWQAGLPTFGQVRIEKIYPGVDVVFYGNQQRLEYDFNLAAGVEPKTIAVRFDGAEKISVNSQGELVIKLDGGEIIQREPVAYQNISGGRHAVKAGYEILDAHTVTFAVGNYDHGRALVIDPILSYSTYFGGNSTEIAHAMALDSNGSIYIAGETLSSTFSNGVPWSTGGAFQTTFHGGTLTGDAFVAKLGNGGTNLIYLTYLGGSDNESALGLAVDNAGDVYLTGYTESPDFPTSKALFGTIAGQINPKIGFYPVDAFVTELNPNGSALIY